MLNCLQILEKNMRRNFHHWDIIAVLMRMEMKRETLTLLSKQSLEYLLPVMLIITSLVKESRDVRKELSKKLQGSKEYRRNKETSLVIQWLRMSYWRKSWTHLEGPLMR